LTARFTSLYIRLQKESQQNDQIIENDDLGDMLKKLNFLLSTGCPLYHSQPIRHRVKNDFCRITRTPRSQHASYRSPSRRGRLQLGM